MSIRVGPATIYRIRPIKRTVRVTDSDVHTLIFILFCYWLYGMNIDTRPYMLQCYFQTFPDFSVGVKFISYLTALGWLIWASNVCR